MAGLDIPNNKKAQHSGSASMEVPWYCRQLLQTGAADTKASANRPSASNPVLTLGEQHRSITISLCLSNVMRHTLKLNAKKMVGLKL